MTPHTSSWQSELASAFTKPNDLLHYLNINIHSASALVEPDFPMRVPLSYAACMEKGNLNDPLLKQVLPIANELIQHTNYINDPVGDLSALAKNCIIHKYQGRVLFITTGACAINCRFCFRRNFPYSEALLNKQKETKALQYLQEHENIHEVILSGGDPLLLSDQRLDYLINQFSAIAHIKRIRIHTRIPIILPARITDKLIDLLNNAALPIVLVTHCNHTNELSEQVEKACLALKKENITLLNQSVLLKDINDNAIILQHLSERLFNCGILPYYLHLLDKATGTTHFEVKQEAALKIHQQLQNNLPGYLVPKLVKEQTGKASKTLLI
ncbi:MAG: EF-P beta-lysylation protein EpmB [Methylococcaceae bacterium]|nr:EF-P beta-lysylation protein EpmB [Methylococcaceae bacterium]